MNKAANNARAFLENMNKDFDQEPETPPKQEPPKAQPQPVEKAAKPKVAQKSVDKFKQKHIGGYCDEETVEEFVILRARLKKDNSALLTEAIHDLYKKYKTKKAFAS